MLTIRIEKKHFMRLKFTCCTNNINLCPLVDGKLIFERNLATLLSQMMLDIFKIKSVLQHCHHLSLV